MSTIVSTLCARFDVLKNNHAVAVEEGRTEDASRMLSEMIEIREHVMDHNSRAVTESKLVGVTDVEFLGRLSKALIDIGEIVSDWSAEETKTLASIIGDGIESAKRLDALLAIPQVGD